MLAKFMSGPMEWGWQPSVRAEDVELYLEDCLHRATVLLDEVATALEAGQPLDPSFVQRARELLEK